MIHTDIKITDSSYVESLRDKQNLLRFQENSPDGI